MIKAESFQSGTTGKLEVSPDGINWTTLNTWVGGDDSGAYRHHEYDISHLNLGTSFWVGFDMAGSSSSDSLHIENLFISK